MELDESEFLEFDAAVQSERPATCSGYMAAYRAVTSQRPDLSLDLSDDERTRLSEQFRREGNDAFKARELQRASQLYTRSIAVAPPASSHRGLGFANRSAVLKARGDFESCLEDVSRALENDYPPLLKFKLLLREAQCYKQLGQKKNATRSLQRAKDSVRECGLQEEKTRQLVCEVDRDFNIESTSNSRQASPAGVYPPPPRLSYGANKEAPSLSSAVSICHDQQFGRHLVAARDINTGDVLLAEAPFAAVLCPHLNFSHCNHCLARCDHLLPCPGCDWALYCSERCQLDAQTKYHAAECTVAARCARLVDSSNLQRCLHYIRIICTLGLTAFKKYIETHTSCNDETRTRGFTGAQYLSNDFHAIYNLAINIEHVSNLMMFAACSIGSLVSMCFDQKEISDVIASFCVQNLLALKSNAHDITHTYLNDGVTKIRYELVGAGIYACASLTNHSCNPNIFRVNYGISNVFHATRSIKKGEQIFDSYKMHFAFDIKNDRMSYLKNHYHFECNCEACNNNWPLFESLPSEITINDKKVKQLYDAMVSATYRCPDDSLPVTKATLSTFIRVINSLSGFATLTQVFQGAQEDVRNYFKSLGNRITYR